MSKIAGRQVRGLGLYAHLQADVRGDRVVLLVKAFDALKRQYEKPRLVLAKLIPRNSPAPGLGSGSNQPTYRKET